MFVTAPILIKLVLLRGNLLQRVSINFLKELGNRGGNPFTDTSKVGVNIKKVIWIKLRLDGQHFEKISYAEFHRNLTNNLVLDARS